jgi:hypothetical protein
MYAPVFVKMGRYVNSKFLLFVHVLYASDMSILNDVCIYIHIYIYIRSNMYVLSPLRNCAEVLTYLFPQLYKK